MALSKGCWHFIHHDAHHTSSKGRITVRGLIKQNSGERVNQQTAVSGLIKQIAVRGLIKQIGKPS